MSNENPENGEKIANSTLSGEVRESKVEFDEAEYAKGQAAIAAKLGLKSTKTIQRWLKHAECPGVEHEEYYHIAKWQAFADKVARKARNQDRASAELEGIQIKNRRAEMDYQEAQGNLCNVTEVAELFAGLAAAAAARLNGSRHTLSPLVVGMTVPEATKRIGDEHRAALMELAVPEWAKKKVGPTGIFWSKVSAALSGHQFTASLGDGPSGTSLSPALP